MKDGDGCDAKRRGDWKWAQEKNDEKERIEGREMENGNAKLGDATETRMIEPMIKWRRGGRGNEKKGKGSVRERWENKGQSDRRNFGDGVARAWMMRQGRGKASGARIQKGPQHQENRSVRAPGRATQVMIGVSQQTDARIERFWLGLGSVRLCLGIQAAD